jgi:polyphosphate kinase
MRNTFLRLIQQEINYQRRHGNGRIIAKMNALDDVPIIQELYRASQAGVQIDLIIRGHSRLRPGLPGISENIRVISILGRFLEHDRIFSFPQQRRRLHVHRQRRLAGAKTSTNGWS